MTLARAEAELLAPGAMFETAEEDVLGERMRVLKRRPRSLSDVLARSADHGDAEYVVFEGGRTLTYRAHLAEVRSLASAMRDRFGVKKGDRVAILAANCPEWIVAFWATVRVGAIAVGLNAWWTGPEIAYALEDCRPKLLIGDAKRLERVSGGEMPIVCIERDWTALASTAASSLAVAIDEDNPAVLLYTSGTTGKPKGALQSHRNVCAYVGLGFFHGMRMAMAFPPREKRSPCTLVTAPLFHVSGLHAAAITALAAGTRTVWMPGRFDPEAALSVIAREKVTAWAYTQALLHRVVHHPRASEHDLSSLHHLGGGGSPIAPSLQARAREVFGSAKETLGVGYGLTECTALATINAGDELSQHPLSVGRPLPTVSIDVRDDEVCIRSPLVMLGYWGNAEATARAIGPGRWLHTGDVGRIEDGRLYLSSRRADLILRGGENVYPAEIEQRLEEHPGVAEAAVIGVDHEELGQEVKALVVAKAGVTLDAAALAAWASEALARFKVPTRWELRETPLPRTATGKVMKHVL